MNYYEDESRIGIDVFNFMGTLGNIDHDRYCAALVDNWPSGDIDYTAALKNWIKKGRPKSAYFAYNKEQKECRLLMSFRKEIGSRFGLPILDKEEIRNNK